VGGNKSNRINSDEFRKQTGEKNGLHVLLSCTSLASGCFTLREWAVLAIRFALEKNQENQRIVEQLEAQDAADSTDIQGLGVKVEVNEMGEVKISSRLGAN